MIDAHIKPGSPGDVLEHFGVKGMRWGVRKERETSGRDRGGAADATERQRVTEMVVGKNATVMNPRGTSQADVKKAVEEAKDGGKGLTDAQKLALGIGAASVVGFVAYKAYQKNMTGFVDSTERSNDRSKLTLPTHDKDGKLTGQSKFDLDTYVETPHDGHGFGGGEEVYQLKNPDDLVVSTSKGYADIRPKDGFPNEYVAKRHEELTRTFEEMRDKYPAVRNLKAEVVPMSQVSGVEMLMHGKSPAAVMHGRNGEIRILYNDTMDGLEPHEADYVRKNQPGVFDKDFLGYHEMGHVLAVAHGDLPPSHDIMTPMTKSGYQATAPKNILNQIRYQKSQAARHEKILKKHGFSFKELSKLSPYGATQPAEALAELAGYYFSPGQTKLTPKQRENAKKLFDEMGGVISQ